MFRKWNLIVMFALVFSLSNCSNKKRAMTTETGTIPGNAAVVGSGSQLGNPGATGGSDQPNDPADQTQNQTQKNLDAQITPTIDKEKYNPQGSGAVQTNGGKAIVASVSAFVSSAVNSTSAIMSYLIGPSDAGSDWDIQVQAVPQ
jgi:hypothetical protein